eukprot:CAMPEP_0117607330 /NCGR_PEP_ID=MMETSP0784-20121206/80197_1 /TAXON_ID=39447 /ORGANISM="" /LENGTH=42 /DNA_ID= /DNA_START= /DNA_END= /DNA_ORIENTATION=
MWVFDCLLGVFVGIGIGAYNAAALRPCLDDTFHLTKQQGTKA